MAITIVTRAVKGSALNAVEFDANLNNIAAAITVNGPLENKIFCIGLLETAKEAVKDFKLAPMDA